MINVIAPSRLMYVSYKRIKIEDDYHYFCLPLEGKSRLVKDNIFIDDPNIKAHEHYLVHGELTGGVTGGCRGLTNSQGKTLENYYGYQSDMIICTDHCYSGQPYGPIDPYGKPYPTDTMTYYYVVRQIEGYSIAILYWINYQYAPEYEEAPYWVQALSNYCVSSDVSHENKYYFWDISNFLPKERFYKNLDQAISAIESAINGIRIGRLIRPFTASENFVFSGDNEFDADHYDIGWLPNLKNFFKFNEYQWVPYNSPMNLSESYSFQHLRQSAFWDAISDIKALNQNSVQTIIEVVQFLIKVKSGKFKIKDIIPSSLSDLWLQYRYQYSTTKLDVEEALEFIEWTGVFSQKDTFFVHGSHSDNGVKCLCKVTVKNRFLSEAKAWWNKLYKYGLQPNFYLVWDTTPFSFIVDWFLPVGDLCNIIDSYNNITNTYDCVNVVYSLQYRAAVGNGGVSLIASLYSRWVENHFPPCEFCYLYEGNNPSNKTIIFRCLDALSLILGRK